MKNHSVPQANPVWAIPEPSSGASSKRADAPGSILSRIVRAESFRLSIWVTRIKKPGGFATIFCKSPRAIATNASFMATIDFVPIPQEAKKKKQG